MVSSCTSEKATVFPYSEVCDATSNFSTSLKIGQGSYGCVYRGKLKGNVGKRSHFHFCFFLPLLDQLIIQICASIYLIFFLKTYILK